MARTEWPTTPSHLESVLVVEPAAPLGGVEQQRDEPGEDRDRLILLRQVRHQLPERLKARSLDLLARVLHRSVKELSQRGEGGLEALADRVCHLREEEEG